MSQALIKRDDIEPIGPCAHYNETEVDAGLLAVATLGGTVRASEHLKSVGLEIPASTLRTWKREQYPRRFTAIAEAHAPEIERAVISLARDAALNAGMGVSEAIDLERERMASPDGVKDASQTAQRLSVAMGVQVDKMLVLQGRPQQITEHRRDANDIVTELSTLAPGLFVDGQAEEIHADEDSPQGQEAGEEIPGQEVSAEAKSQQEARNHRSTGPDTQHPQS